MHNVMMSFLWQNDLVCHNICQTMELQFTDFLDAERSANMFCSKQLSESADACQSNTQS